MAWSNAAVPRNSTAHFAAGRLPEPSTGADQLLTELRTRVDVVDYSGWEAIDAHERALGEPAGRPRVKLVRREEQLHRATVRA